MRGSRDCGAAWWVRAGLPGHPQGSLYATRARLGYCRAFLPTPHLSGSRAAVYEHPPCTVCHVSGAEVCCESMSSAAAFRCTQVRGVLGPLWAAYPTAEAMAAADPGRLSELLRPLGLHRRWATSKRAS